MIQVKSSTKSVFQRHTPNKNIVSIFYEVSETKESYPTTIYHKYRLGSICLWENGLLRKEGLCKMLEMMYKRACPYQLGRRRGKNSKLRVNLAFKFITARGYLLKGTFVLYPLDLLEQSFRNAIFEQPTSKRGQLFEFQARVLSHFNLLSLEARTLEQFGDLDSENESYFLEEAA